MLPLLEAIWEWLLQLFHPPEESPDIPAGHEPIRINVLPDHGSFARRDTVTGAVLIRGGSSLATLSRVSLLVVEPGTSIKPSSERQSIVLADELTVEPKQVMQLRFSFRMPDDMPVSEDGDGVGMAAYGCGIVVSVISPSTRIEINSGRVHVAIEPGLKALLQAMSECGFAALDTTLVENNEDAEVRHFQAKSELRAWLTDAELRVAVHSDEVVGRLTLHPAVHGFSESLRTMMGGPKPQTISFSTPYAELITDRNKPNIQAGKRVIQQALADSMLVGDQDRSSLLRSSSVEAASVLLQPASPYPAPSSTRNAELLRPADPASSPEDL